MMNRRAFLKSLALLALLPTPVLRADPALPSQRVRRLQERIQAAIGSLAIGFELRQIDPADGYTFFTIQVRADRLYPVASCFKFWLVLYYLMHTPPDEWQLSEDSPAYRAAVFSNNILTARLLADVGERIPFYGNPIEKFNDFLIYIIGMENGLHSWNYPNTATAELVDSRFEPSETRVVRINEAVYRMDNIITAADLATGYAALYTNPFTDFAWAGEAITAARGLFAIPATSFQSPIERAFGQGYMGKDGALRERDSAIGVVTNDAGVLTTQDGTYIIAFLAAGVGEYVSVEILREIAAALRDYERGA